MTPSVSIVIVNWKTPELLAACLDSVFADSKASEFEVWVVDNDSGDHSVPMLLERFSQVKVIANKENVGFARACNQVIPLATGRHVLLLNPDTVVVGDAVSTMAEFLDANPDVGSVGPKVLNPDGSLQLACRRSFPTPAASFYRLTYLSKLFPKSELFARYNLTYADPNQQLDVDALSGSCMMVRSSVVTAVGLLDEDIFMFGEDIDWCWRFKEAGWRVTYLPQAAVFHYHGASSRLRPVGATINLHKGMEVFYRKHQAPKHGALFNLLVYGAIWFRAMIFVILTTVQAALPKKRILSVVASSGSNPLTPEESARELEVVGR